MCLRVPPGIRVLQVKYHWCTLIAHDDTLNGATSLQTATLIHTPNMQISKNVCIYNDETRLLWISEVVQFISADYQ
jgi:hypothetical protein